MLAIKECLIREGALNLNQTSRNNRSNDNDNNNGGTSSSSSIFNALASAAKTGENDANSCHTPYNMYDNDNRLPSKLLLDNHNLSKSVSTSNKNDFEIIESATIYLNSASATAKKSCQQQKQLQPDLQSQFEQQLEQQQQKQHQQEQQQQQINQKNTTGTKRYQGHHPHFHHHTTPAYYTDLHLRIHTPEAKDSLNENYQSVYRTPTNLVKDERQFPKSSTATVAPPPISGKNSTKSDSINNNNNNIPTEKLNKAATSAFFRGGTAIKEPQKISEIYARSSPTSATNPVKGNLDIDSPRTARVVASSIVPFNSVTSTAEHKTQSLNKPISGSTSAERSRNCKRFSNRKKVVRVRSESRPISALYEIICKETGHDLITTSTNDEDSSSVSNISDDENIRNHHARRSRRSHSSSLSRQNKLHGTGNSSTMSGGLENSSGGDFPQQKPNAQLKKSNPIYINDLSEDDDDLVHVEGGCSRKNLRLRVTQKTTNLLDEKRQPRKVASLPHNQISQDTHHHIPQQFHIYIPSVETSSSSNAPLRNIHSLKQVDSKSSEHKKELPNISSSNKSSSNNNIGCTIPLVGGTDLQGNEECSAQDEMKTGATDKALTLFPTASTPYESLMSPKGARFTRKYKRNRDEKQRRHTVSSIKLTNDASENDDQQQQKQEQQQQQQQQQQQKKQQQYNQDLNGAGHENHALPPTNASKRYITRNQQRNNSSGLNGNVSPHSVHAVIPSDSLPPPELGTATVTAETSAIIKNKRAIATGGKPTTKSTKPTTKATTTTTTINSDKHYIDMTNSAKVSATSAKNASPTELKSSSAIGGAGSCGGGGGGGVEADSNGTLSNATATTTSSTTSIPNRNMQIPDKKKDDPTSPKHHLMLNASVSLGVTQGISNSDSEQQQGNKLSSPTSAYNNCQQSVIGKKSIATASCYANRSRSINLKTNSACLLKTFKQKSQNSDTTIKTKEPKISKSSTLSSQMIRKDDIKFIKNIYGEPEEIEEEEHRYVEEDEEVDDDENENDNDNDDDDDDDDNDDNDDDDDDDNRDNVNDDCDDNDDDRDDGNDEEEYEEDDMLEINDLPAISMNFTKPLYSPNVVSPDINNTLERMETLDLRQSLDKVRKCNEERDKSSKRKSNLNRSLNEEAAFDNDESAALRRRRRRELGMARQLVPGDDEAIAVRDLISPQKYKCTLEDEKTKISPTTQVCYLDMTHKGIDSTNTTKNQTANDNGYGETYKGMYTLGYHMEMARKGQDKMNERRRGQISSPRKEKTPPRAISKPNRINDPALLDDLKMQRSSDVNRKVNERTRADLADIIKIAELANECTQSTCNAISILNETVNLLRVNQVTVDSEGERKPSPAKHATFLEEECIYYEPYPLENCDAGTDNDDENLQASPVGGGILRTQRMLKARSVEGDVGYEIPKLSPILRRKSTDDPAGGISTGTSQIVSILKKKDHLSAGDSSSASSNASPVTFSSNVVDTPTKQKRAGILKKRSSLDESRYYSRSHSPDERSILVKSARRNSLEETAAGSNSTTSGHHGILKQSSYDSNKSDGCPSASGESSQPHSILKKKDSTSTPCDGASGHSSKHVSISQAVILAAAELYAAETGISPSSNGHDSLGFTPNNEEYELRPILKPETPSTEESIRPPKPILKKKSLGDSDEHEIKPILKTSRKSSREESDLSNVHGEGEQSGEPLVKPILKTDSPSKRRSLGDADHTEEDRSPDSSLLKRRTRSLERQDAPIIDLGEALNAIATSQTQANELATTLTNSVAGQNFSVAERIKCMEKFLNFTSAGNQTRDSITSLDLPCVVASAPDTCFKQVTSKRELYKDRFKTQPVTNEEKNAKYLETYY
uniref:HP domain-containing protein n=2 Tax=Glossina morsitans morsitans TaxID=37546 RepID=A0ABK9MGB2_GLOMM